MLNLVLSHFDSTIGPKVFLNIPKLSNQILLEKIPSLMDLYEEAFFIHEFDEFKTANLIFTIPSPSPYTRGGQESLMISIVLLKEEEMDLKVFQELLKQLVAELKKIKELYRVFNRQIQNIRDNQVVYKKIEELLHSFYHSLPKETIFMKTRDISLALFDFFKNGISPIADNLKKFISIGQYPKNKFENVALFNTNLSVYEYSIDKPMNSKFLLFQLKNNDGFIFVVEEINNILLKIAELTLNFIFNSSELASIPSLILFNKTTTEGIEIQKLIKELRIDEDENKTIKFVPIKAYDNDEIREAFNWILDKIAIKEAQVAIM
ncbi:MAG: ADP-ribosylation factor-like protein [Promethearchaeota archaeon]|jgi:hypothetical protein